MSTDAFTHCILGMELLELCFQAQHTIYRNCCQYWTAKDIAEIAEMSCCSHTYVPAVFAGTIKPIVFAATAATAAAQFYFSDKAIMS